jgi:hypothetical protein
MLFYQMMNKLLDRAEEFSAILALIVSPNKSSFLAPATLSGVCVIATLEDTCMSLDVPVRSADATLQRVGAEAILHDHRNGRAHVINNSAARIWELIDGQANVEQIAGAFAAIYAMPASEVYDDVLAILATFRELRVLD